MKKIFSILLLLFSSLAGIAQPAETHNFITYDTTISIPNIANPFGPPDVYTCRISRPVNMFTPGSLDTASRPCIFMMPGQGEQGTTDTNKLVVWGPHYWLNNGWDGSVVLGNGKHYPILITSIYANNVFPTAPSYYALLTILLNTFHIKRNAVCLTGLSQGAFTAGAMIKYEVTAGAETGMKIVTAIAALEGTPDPLPAPYNGWDRDTVAYKVWAAKYGGRYFYLEGNGADNFRDGWHYAQAMNDSVPASAYFSYEKSTDNRSSTCFSCTAAAGSHCCWNSMYDPSATNWTSVGTLGPLNAPSQAGTNTMGSYFIPSSIFQWLLRQGDSSLVVGGFLTATACCSQTVTLPTNSVSLTGSGTTPSGTTITGYTWTKTSGGSVTITSPTSQNTTVTGLAAGSYTFLLTITNSASNTATSSVTITVNPTPSVVKQVVVAEYRTWYIRSDSTIWAFNNGSPQAVQFTIGGNKCIGGSGAFNYFRVLDQSGYVWTDLPYSQSVTTNNATRTDTDTTGAAFSGNWYINAYGNVYATIRADSSVWYGGNDAYSLFYPGGQVPNLSLGTLMRPTQLSPTGWKFKKIIFGGDGILGLTTAGAVYKWFNNGSRTPTLISLPRPAIDIFISSLDFNGAIIPDPGETSGMGYPFVWSTNSFGPASMYGNPGAAYTTPTSVKSLWNMTVPIREIAVGWNTIHYIDSLGRLFGGGFNPMGEVGNGQGFVNKYYYPGYPGYGWDFNNYENPSGVPAQIGTSTSWKHLYKNGWFAYYTVASDNNDSLWSWGRNKSLVLGNGLENAQEPTSYDALDVLSPTMVHPLSALFTLYNFTAPSLTAQPNQTIAASSTIIQASGNPALLISVNTPPLNGIDTAGYGWVSYQWSQDSGTTCTIVTPNAKSTAITGLVPDRYVFHVVATDNNTGQDTAKVIVIVSAGLPTVNAGPNQTVTAPADVFFTGASASGVGGATIVSANWTKVNGFTNGSFINPTSLTGAGFHGLQVGSYIFQLTVTDSNGKSNTSTLTVNYLPAIIPNGFPFHKYYKKRAI